MHLANSVGGVEEEALTLVDNEIYILVPLHYFLKLASNVGQTVRLIHRSDLESTMTTNHEKSDMERIEAADNSTSSQISDIGGEKGVVQQQDYIPNEARDGDVVTLKTWMVILARILVCYIWGKP